MELDLVARCRQGDPEAFEEVYHAHAPRLYGLARRLVGPAAADDLLQDIFLAAFRKLHQYRGESALGTWLFRLATNVCLDHLRSRSTRSARLEGAFDEHATASGSSAGPIRGVVTRLDFERALAGLPDGARTVFVLHEVEGLEHQEVAALLGISEGTSKSQLHKARMRLRQQLGTRRTTPREVTA